MKKRALSLALAMVMACGLMTPARAAGSGYPDAKGHYAEDAVNAWSGYGVLKGYPDGTFRPDGNITRAEMAAVLDRIMGYQNKAENTFSDVPTGKWYEESILHLAAQEIFKGNPDGTMEPDAPITRQEAITAMARALELEESDKAPGFVDDDTIADWARGYLSAMKRAGYIQGDEKGRIQAADPITRAEVVTILNKMATAFVNADGTYSKDCKGNLIVNAKNVTLKDMTIEGDLLVADGVADGDVYLDKVTVEGDIILRGCGEHSFHIMPGCEVKNIIVTKTTKGRIRLVNESGKTIPMIYINDGKSGVVLDGNMLGDVVIACDAPVTITAKKVETVYVTGNARVTVEKGSTIAKVDVARTAKEASLTVEGKVTAIANNAEIKVEKQNGGTVGGSLSGGNSGGGSSSGGSSGGSSSGGSGGGSSSGDSGGGSSGGGSEGGSSGEGSGSAESARNYFLVRGYIDEPDANLDGSLRLGLVGADGARHTITVADEGDGKGLTTENFFEVFSKDTIITYTMNKDEKAVIKIVGRENKTDSRATYSKDTKSFKDIVTSDDCVLFVNVDKIMPRVKVYRIRELDTFEAEANKYQYVTNNNKVVAVFVDYGSKLPGTTSISIGTQVYGIVSDCNGLVKRENKVMRAYTISSNGEEFPLYLLNSQTILLRRGDLVSFKLAEDNIYADVDTAKIEDGTNMVHKITNGVSNTVQGWVREYNEKNGTLSIWNGLDALDRYGNVTTDVNEINAYKGKDSFVYGVNKDTKVYFVDQDMYTGVEAGSLSPFDMISGYSDVIVIWKKSENGALFADVIIYEVSGEADILKLDEGVRLERPKK